MKRVFLVLMTALLALPFNAAAKSGKPADIVINLTTTLDGKAVSKAVTRYQQQNQRAMQ